MVRVGTTGEAWVMGWSESYMDDMVKAELESLRLQPASVADFGSITPGAADPAGPGTSEAPAGEVVPGPEADEG